MLNQLSNQIADAVAAVAPAVVQVQGATRPASGLVFADDVVLTTVRALGGEDRARVRTHDGSSHDAQLVGWDSAVRIALLRVPDLHGTPIVPAAAEPRVGHLGIGVARSWSNAVTATAGLVSVIGGPLRTGRRRSIERVFRTSAPMHEGFAGGAFINPEGGLVGVATAAVIRGLGVIIPASIAWTAAHHVLAHGTAKQGYLGIAAQPVRVSQKQADISNRSEAILVVGVKDGSPAADAGLLVGDILLSLDGQPLGSPDDLLDLLRGDRVGRRVALNVLRGDQPITAEAQIAER